MVKNILFNETDVQGEQWAFIILFDSCVPPLIADNFQDIGGELLCWNGFDNAIGYKYSTINGE